MKPVYVEDDGDDVKDDGVTIDPVDKTNDLGKRACLI